MYLSGGFLPSFQAFVQLLWSDRSYKTIIEREEESQHIDRVGTRGRSFLWKNLYNAIYDLRFS